MWGSSIVPNGVKTDKVLGESGIDLSWAFCLPPPTTKSTEILIYQSDHRAWNLPVSESLRGFFIAH